eukprot:5073392-Amphidinium_carterae.1
MKVEESQVENAHAVIVWSGRLQMTNQAPSSSPATTAPRGGDALPKPDGRDYKLTFAVVLGLTDLEPPVPLLEIPTPVLPKTWQVPASFR